MAFAKIMCPVDFSPGSDRALETAVRIAGEAHAELVLVHAWYVPPATFGGEYTYAADVIRSSPRDRRPRARLARLPNGS